jgi:hypothetical protein
MKTKRKAEVAFWDTSAIVPLCCQQNLSQSIRKRWRETSRVVAWWGTTVDVRSAISRLHNEGLLSAKGHEWREMMPSDKVRSLAERLPILEAVRQNAAA